MERESFPQADVTLILEYFLDHFILFVTEVILPPLSLLRVAGMGVCGGVH